MDEQSHDPKSSHHRHSELPQEPVDSEVSRESATLPQEAGAKMREEADRPGQVSGPPKDQPELNRAQTESNAAPDAVAEGGASDGDPINTSDSSGLRQDDEAAGELRKRQYKNGAGLVSGTD
jgi:hypothetical protein